MKILYLVLAAVFLLFAFLQVNDPDPVLWILIYGLMAVSCILGAFGHFYKPALIVLLIIYAGYSAVYFSGVMQWLRSEDKSMLFDNLAKMQYPYIEETREFLGLWICVIILLLQLITPRLRKKSV